MKRAIPTPNRFTTYIPTWWGKILFFFVSLIVLGSCLDESALIGIKKDHSRFGVIFKEFSIPATTVQLNPDSLRTQNTYYDQSAPTGGRIISPDRLLLGSAVDPIFGTVSSSIFTRFVPYSGKLNGLTDVVPLKLTLTLTLDYYVFGDSNSSAIDFSVHEITDPTFDGFEDVYDYYASTNVIYSNDPIATGSYFFNKDSIKKSIALNTNTSTTDNRIDTLYIEFPIDGAFAQHLIDTALAKGLYSLNSSNVLAFNGAKTDTAFRKAFNGLAIKATSANKIIGLRGSATNSKITLYYSYSSDGVQKYGEYYYAFDGVYFGTPDIPMFSSIKFDRTGTQLETLITPNTEFNAPDDYCYIQSGTGLFTKLDFTEVVQYFDTIPNRGINSAELIIPLEATETRQHMNEPTGLALRVLSSSNGFFKPPIENSVYNPEYAARYYCLGEYIAGYIIDGLDAVGDEGVVLRLGNTSTNGRIYTNYLSEFLEYQVRIPSTFQKVYSLGLLPTNSHMGKSFHGVSFKKDQVKLKVYYTRPN